MEIDELMRSPGMVWVFRGYAIAAALGGLILFGWGPMWFGIDLPGLPNYGASLVRTAGGILLAFAGCLAALNGIEDPFARRRALLWLALGHIALLLVLVSQQVPIWNSGLVKNIELGLVMIVTALLFFWSGLDFACASPREWAVLFGRSSVSRESLSQRYQREIRAAALHEERHRLARDLHDSVKQQIFAIQTAAATAQARFESDAAGARAAIDQIRASAHEAMSEMEAMLDNLRAAPIETGGLVEAIRKQCEALGFRTGAKVDLELGGSLVRLSLEPGAAEAAFRIAQEALANVGRHARAANVKVAVFADPHFLRLTVTDDGRGFDPAQPDCGMGIANMRSRAEEFRGTFELTSSPGRGTSITAAVPVLRQRSLAAYNRWIIGYSISAAAFFFAGWWAHFSMFHIMGIIWCIYVIRAAIGRSAVRRSPGAGR
jgi:signal transduction histidine kinase